LKNKTKKALFFQPEPDGWPVLRNTASTAEASRGQKKQLGC